MAVGRAAVANSITTYIKDRMIQPVAHNVPMAAMADPWQLPDQGDTLRVPRASTPVEATLLDKDTAYNITNTTGEHNITVPYDEYVVGEYGLFCRILKWAKYTSGLDLAKQIGNRLTESGALTLCSLAYDAMASQSGGQWLRVDGQTETRVEMAFTINSATGILVTACRTDLTDIDDWWNNGQVTFTSGPNRGLSRAITDFANSNGLLTFSAFPNLPTNGDAGFVTVLGNGVSSGPSDLASTDLISLTQLYRARERCLRFGAGGLGIDDEVMDVTGETSKRDGMIRQGMVFMPTKLVHELTVSLAGNATAQDQAFWQTSEGLQRAVGGVIKNVGGLMVVPVNYYKQCAISDGALAVGTGTCHPSVILFPHAFGCTLLKDNPGNRQGLDVNVKAPGKNDIGHMWQSIKYQGELDVINKMFCANSLFSAVLWSGTNLV